MNSRVGAIAGAAAAITLAMPACKPAHAEDAPAHVNPYEGMAGIVPDGNSLFNQYCSHCHGPNAAQGERPRDLRRLKLRYGDDAINVFYKTTHEGRLEKGMPIWAGVLSDDVLWKIYTFLGSVQSEE